LSQEELLKEISSKLDGIFVILKISNMENLKKIKKELIKDKVNSKILQLSNGTRNYSTLSKEIAKELGVSEINVKKKISELTRIGAIIAEKSHSESYYKTTGLLDWGANDERRKTR